ncbi:GyrI-like domain-containing protein [Flagellimonas eckloniae]|uniref:AraC family transcriptional regulator n=1 Tax=Flagellimonas eckloniae TaxID=346185 RepID=A0A0Q0XIH4_9FLAO|nr:GyrI-like domain-containing protein [Allomuricauda eckloniae]KQC30762.1 AraC family transcriptional regulator [Allomuricauda eckloniae]
MQSAIKLLHPKKLVGVSLSMNLLADRTGELWGSLMPRVHEIKNRATSDLISMQVYDPSYFTGFDPKKGFTKWAVAEVTNFDTVPNEMNHFTLEGGMYAVFFYKGPSQDKSIFQYIFTKWLPNSEYLLDNRPHFEVLGSRYRSNDPNSEEEIWIPVREK